MPTSRRRVAVIGFSWLLVVFPLFINGVAAAEIEYSSTTPVSVGGTGGSEPVRFLCEGEQLLVGLRLLEADANTYATSLGIYCVPAPITTADYSEANTNFSNVLGTGGTSVFCPRGTVAVGLQVASSRYVYGAGLVCDTPVSTGAAPRTTEMIGKAKPNATLDCPTRDLLVGVISRRGAGVDLLGGVCRAPIVPVDYNVRFDVQGGSSPAPTARTVQSTKPTVTLPDYTGTKLGFTFAGWSDGAEQPTLAAGSAYIVTKSVTFVAQWAPTVYEIQFLNDGKPVLLPIRRASGSSFEFPPQPDVKRGYEFVGWTDGERNYEVGDTYVLKPADAPFVFSIVWKSVGSPATEPSAAATTPPTTPAEDPTATSTVTPTAIPSASSTADPDSSTNVAVATPDSERDARSELGLLAAGLAMVAAFSSRRSQDRQRQELEEVNVGDLQRLERSTQWGDASATWKLPGGRVLERMLAAAAVTTARYSRIIGRSVADAAYARAALGSAYLVLPALAIAIGIGLQGSADAPTPPPMPVLIAAIALGVADAFSGLLIAGLYAIDVVASGAITTFNDVLTLIAIMAVFFAPSLLASSVRPFRRLVHAGDDRWERISDFALGSLFGGWAVANILSGLPALAGRDFDIVGDATTIGAYAGGFVLLRMLLEDAVQRAYPRRLHAVTPDIEARWRGYTLVTAVTKSAVFAFLLVPFIGIGWELAVGTAMFAVGLFEDPLTERLPGSQRLTQWVPSAVFKALVLLFLGTIVAKLLPNVVADPDRAISIGFVILSVPGLALVLLRIASDPAHDSTTWRTTDVGRYTYRVAGAAVFAVLLASALGHDITTWMFA